MINSYTQYHVSQSKLNHALASAHRFQQNVAESFRSISSHVADTRPKWWTKKWPDDLIQAQHGCYGPVKLPNHHIHALLPPMACISFHSPSCLTWYPSADLKRGRRWKAVKTCLLLELELHEFMPKKPNFKFELLKCNKAPFSCLLSPSSFPSAPNRWQMWRSLVMWAFSCWAGKMEASTHFLENPKNSSSSQLVPITAMKDKQEGGKDQNNFPTLGRGKINNRISWGLHFPSSSFFWALRASFLIFF